MRGFFVGSAIAIAIAAAVACSSFEGDAAPIADAGPDAESDSPAPDGGTDAPTPEVVEHATGHWLVGFGSHDVDDAPAGIAWSGDALFVSATVGGPASAGQDATGDGGVRVFKGAAVIKMQAGTGTYGGLYNFTGADADSFIAGPITASTEGVYAAATLGGAPNRDVLLRHLGSADLTLVAMNPMLDVKGDGDQAGYAATADGTTGALFALQVKGPTQVGGGGPTGADPTPEPGIVSFTAAAPSPTTGYFAIGTTMSALPTAIAIDANGRVGVAGYFTGKLAEPDGGAADVPDADEEDGFVARFKRTGQLIDKVVFSGGNAQHVTSLATYENERYVAGTFDGTVAWGAHVPVVVKGVHGFVAQINDSNEVGWFADLGPVSGTFVGVAADAARVVASGTFVGTTKIGEDELVSHGASDIFLASFTRQSGAPRGAVRFGQAQDEILTAMTTNVQGTFFLAGTFVASTFLDGKPPVNANGARTDMFVLSAGY